MLKNDQSLTCLAGKKIRKSIPILSVLGDLDELIACLGVVRASSKKKTLEKELKELQKELVQFGGVLAGAKVKKVDWAKKAKTLEERIKKTQNFRQKKFLLPGKSQPAAFLHLSRAVTRRLERRVVGLRKKNQEFLVNYLNRLSLLLFWLALKEEK